MAGIRVAVVGATGLVGRAILEVLEERGFPVGELIPLASERSAGKSVAFHGEPVPVGLLDDRAFAGCDLAFFSAGAAVSRRYAPIAARHAAMAIDNSSAFRQDPDVPLVVPEVNGGRLDGYQGIVANPNCSTIQMVVALQALHAAFGLEMVIVSTYQSVSGSGARGVQALDHEISTCERPASSPYAHPIAFNVLPHIDVFGEGGWSGEERKMMLETRKIMELPLLHVVATTARVPVRVGHSESVYARFGVPVTVAQAHQALTAAVGVILEDDPTTELYPYALRAAGRNEVFVGRVRQDPGDARALAFWVVADNLRKGAATNAVQIAERSLELGVLGPDLLRKENPARPARPESSVPS